MKCYYILGQEIEVNDAGTIVLKKSYMINDRKTMIKILNRMESLLEISLDILSIIEEWKINNKLYKIANKNKLKLLLQITENLIITGGD